MEKKICPVCKKRYADWGWHNGPKVDGKITWKKRYVHIDKNMKLKNCVGKEIYDATTRQQITNNNG